MAEHHSPHSVDEGRTPPRPSLASSSFEGSTDTLTFFADAQLDLDEAHDIAETPEATKPNFDQRNILSHKPLQLPHLSIAEEATATEEEPHRSAVGDADRSDFSRITGGNLEITERLVMRKKKPRWPRDLPWTIAFLAVVPTTLLFASATNSSQTTISWHPIVLAFLVTIVLVQWIYRSPPGGEGDDMRHRVVTLLSWAAPISAIVLYACLAVALARRHSLGAVLPLLAMMRDVYSVRRWHRPGTGVSGYASRIGTFQAVNSMALDILSRSLRPHPLLRNIYAFGTLQIFVVFWWRHAMRRNPWVALLVGKWATAVVMRCLTYLSSAAVLYWCAAQQPPAGQQQETNYTGGGDGYDDDDLPEAYRTVDASVYQPVTTTDDLAGLIADDDDDLQEEVLQDCTSTNTQQLPRHTVKSILWNGVSVSFGSIAACGLLGGIAQFAWSQLRRLPQTNLTGVIQTVVVHRYNDLAMTHVAMYYKGYVRSAKDVAAIMEASGKFLG